MKKFILFALLLVLSGCETPKIVGPCGLPEGIILQDSPPPFVCPQMDKRNSKYLIVIDAGHGGDDFGAHSNHRPYYQEKHLNLSTANLVKTYLSQYGYQTVMTRTRDLFISLDKRAAFANGKKPDLFVSVHYNSAPSKEAEGIEVYFYRSEKDKIRTKESKLLAQCVLEDVIENTRAKSRGVKHGNFAVIRETNMPAILIEGGFLTNDREMEKIKDPVYLKKLAWGIAKGIHEYIHG